MEQLTAGSQTKPKVLISQCHITLVEDTDILVDGAAPHRMRADKATSAQITIIVRRPLPDPLALMLFKGLMRDIWSGTYRHRPEPHPDVHRVFVPGSRTHRDGAGRLY